MPFEGGWPRRWPGTRPTEPGGSPCGPGPGGGGRLGPIGRPDDTAQRERAPAGPPDRGTANWVATWSTCWPVRPRRGPRSTGRRRRDPPGVATTTFEVLSTDIDTLDITDRTAVRAAIEGVRPDIVLHGGAWTAVDACESDPDTAFAVNALGTRNMAEAARPTRGPCGLHLDRLCLRRDAGPALRRVGHPRPAFGLRTEQARRGARSGRRGRSRRHHRADGLGERCPRRQHGQDRSPAGRCGPDGTLRFVDDQHGCPTFTADLARAVVRLALDRRPGMFHVTNQGETTWFGFARATLAAAGLDPVRVEPIATSDLDPPRPAPDRPTRGSTTPPCVCPVSPSSRSGPTPSVAWSTFWCRRLITPLDLPCTPGHHRRRSARHTVRTRSETRSMCTDDLQNR